MRQPADILASIPAFEQAEVLRVLNNGPRSNSWLVATAEGQFVLRKYRPQALDAAIYSQTEARVLSELSRVQYIKGTVWTKVEAGLVLRPFIDGRAWESAEFHDLSNLSALANELKHLHGLSVSVPEFELEAKLNGYAARINTKEAHSLASETVESLAKVQDTSTQVAICHNDPVTGNVIGNARVRLIDWEYAAAGDVNFDLAAVIEHHGLTAQEAEHFAASYWGSMDTRRAEKLRIWQTIYRQTVNLWEQAILAGRR